jgi:anti-sigma B factor antagonist
VTCSLSVNEMDAPAEQFSVDARPGAIEVSGEVDMQTAPRLRTALITACDPPGREVEVDLTEVGFIDSSGINELLRISTDGCPVVVVGMSPTVERTFTLLGLDQVFDLRQRAVKDETAP